VERYEKRTAVKRNDKSTPQQQWMELIQSSIETAPAHLKHYLQSMANMDNVPKKEKQFRNFATSSLNLRGNRNSETIVTDIWNQLQGLRAKQRVTAEAQGKDAGEKKEERGDQVEMNEELNDAHINPMPPTKESTCRNKSKPDVDKKTVKKAMKKVLKKAVNHTLTTKRLKKALQDHLGMPKSARSQLKELVQLNLQASKKRIFREDGKSITLIVE
jgi:hypothetical protein